jgi:hypothetical protein
VTWTPIRSSRRPSSRRSSEQGLRGIVLDIIGLGGEIPPAARAELEDGLLELSD